ncbi:hypothetical protein [Pedobacter duraquae]|uniref:Uncharacterized protein n=1 Tax=Pedobacter duraquae TaxID=425511 RepID=A0A4R6IG26_9SPHI|nr:hypothetical protein [Pedobacter duraquae]TDO20711.1 hypothetical protein CLV32_3344 [Pedobacter duraquae]
MSRGINHCYWKTNGGPLARCELGKTYYLYDKDTNEFLVDETCVDADNKNKKTTVANARWSVIYNELFATVEKGGEPQWAKLGPGAESVKKWGIGTRYKTGSSLKFSPSGSNFYFGFKQRIELFSYNPGSGFYFHVLPVGKNSINFAYFYESERVRRYGEMISVQVAFHGYNLDKHNDYEGWIYLLDADKSAALRDTEALRSANLWEKPKSFAIDGSTSANNFNYTYAQTFPIDIAWKKGENKQKNFTVAVEVYKKIKSKSGKVISLQRVEVKNFGAEPTKDLITYDTNVLKIKDTDQKESISSRFMVSEELMDHYLQRTEQAKVEQIQYIGDIRYTHKEFDPCGYSTITVNDADHASVIFDENATDGEIDKTAKTFDVITGDVRKDITIKVGALTTKGVLCNGLLLAAGEKHSARKNLFQMDKVMPALRLEGKAFVTRPDISDKKDQDVVPDGQRGESKDVSEVQEWIENRDYKFQGEDTVVLMLRYVYNKTFLEKYTSKVTKDDVTSVNALWVLNHFLLTRDKVQTYYLPVSTCRYPNQLVKVKIYPDMEWELAALVAVPAWKKTVFKFESSRQDLRGYHNNFAFAHTRQTLEAKVETESKVGVDVTLTATTSGNTFQAGYKIEKAVKKTVATFNSVYNGLAVFDGRSPTASRNSAAIRTGSVRKFEFNIDPPNVAFALKWKHALATSPKFAGQIGTRIEGGVALKPFIGIGITVDLIPIASKLAGAVGTAIEWIIKALEYAIDGLDIYFNFKLEAEIAAELSIGWHDLDGWDEKAKREITMLLKATLEAGVDYEGTVIASVVRGDVTEETLETFKAKASIGGGVEYKEAWDSDKQGMFKTVTVEFTGMKANLEVYAAIVRRKKTVINPDWKETSDKKVDVKASKEFVLLDKKTWYGPKKIYTDDETDDDEDKNKK